MQQSPVAAAASAQQPQQPQPQPQQSQQQQPPQQQPQQTGNGASRPATQAPQPTPQIRAQSAVPQVNISQQQRMPTPMSAAAARMSPQQILQVQAAQAQARANAITQSQAQVHAQLQAQAQAQVQAQAQGTPQAALSSLPAGAHLSPPYHSRAATSSPGIGVAQQASPPRTAVTPSNAGVAASPRPQSAQPQPPMPSPQIPGNAMPRPTSSIAAHYLPVVPPGTHFTQEQMDQALRLSSLMQVRFLVRVLEGEAIFTDRRSRFGAADDDGAGTARRTVPFTELAVHVVGGLSDVFSCPYFPHYFTHFIFSHRLPSVTMS